MMREMGVMRERCTDEDGEMRERRLRPGGEKRRENFVEEIQKRNMEERWER